MESQSNLTNQNQTNSIENDNLVQSKVVAGTSFNISGGINVQGGHALTGNNQFGDNANFSLNNSQSNFSQSISPTAVNNVSKPTEQSGMDEEIKQPIKNNSSTPVSGEGCCSLKIGKLGCGNVMSFWCFNLEPSAEDVYLVCCPKGPSKQAQQATEEINSTNNQSQYQSVPQMEAQVQVNSK